MLRLPRASGRHRQSSLSLHVTKPARRIAPCWPGAEENNEDETLEECNICMLHYPALNRSRCCGNGICTECFLQVAVPAAALAPLRLFPFALRLSPPADPFPGDVQLPLLQEG